MAHIHLKAYFELALHDEDDHDEADGAQHDPQEQLGRGQTTHTVTAMIRMIEREGGELRETTQSFCLARLHHNSQ